MRSQQSQDPCHRSMKLEFSEVLTKEKSEKKTKQPELISKFVARQTQFSRTNIYI